MSDEPPPSLRLKPRTKPELDSDASSAEAAANPPAKGPEEGGMKIRLRPKLLADADAIDPATGLPAPSAPLEELPAPASEPEAPLEPEVIEPVAPVAEAPKFRLKTRAAEAAPATPAPPSTPPPTQFAIPSADDEGKPPAMMQFEPGSEEAALNIPMPSSPLYVPTVETPATESIRLDLSVPPPPPEVEEEVDTSPPAYAPTRRGLKVNIKTGTIGLIAAVIFILGCGAFFVHRVVNQPSAAPSKNKSRIRSIPVPVEPTPVPTPTPTPLPEKEDLKPKPGSNLVTTSIAPGISATTGPVEAINASPAFRSWVAAARISGVFQGATPRALINGRTIRAGQVADEALSITFESIEAESKTITFKDRSGAEVSRRY